MKVLIFVMLILFAFSALSFEVEPKHELKRLLQEVDRDRDEKITIKDKEKASSIFMLKTTQGKKLPVEGIYYLSNLLQELKLGEETNHQKIEINDAYIFENPVERISRNIKDRFWDGLTRKIDKSNLLEVLVDPKIPHDEFYYLYVPHSDDVALKYYQSMMKDHKKLKVIQLPAKITPEYVESLGKRHGLLSLALRKSEGKTEGVPYVVPGGRFNELYGWDSYFHVLGLVQNHKVELARDIIDNFAYEIKHYGKILNANRTYYLTRSQPPFMTSMIRTVMEKLPKNRENLDWLKENLLLAISEYESVWMGEERLTKTGLSRYAGFAAGIPPEVETGHFSSFLTPFAKKYKVSMDELVPRFNAGEISDPEMIEFFNHDRAVRESGHDTTYRWRVNGVDRASDFVTVDLNSLLYKYELDLSFLIKKYFKGNLEGKTHSHFERLARERKKLIRKYLWNDKEGLFFDYNWKDRIPSQYLSATTFYPLWAYEKTIPDSKILNDEEARHLVKHALSRLEAAGGITSTDLESLRKFGDPLHARQWEYPNGWAPHQVLAWQGLLNYGFIPEANRLIYKWLYLITKNAMDYNGTIPEKYDVVKMSHDVFAEYGNVGTKFSYITREGFGWMNASYIEGLQKLPSKHRKQLEKVIPVEWVEF